MNKENFDNLPQQAAYAKLLQALVNTSLVMIIISFIVYLTGVLDPLIAISDLPRYWSLPLHEFITETNSPIGWNWISYLDKGDYLNFLGIAFMGATTGICYLAMVFSFFKEKNNIALIVAIIELFLILLAASNVIAVGGH